MVTYEVWTQERADEAMVLQAAFVLLSEAEACARSFEDRGWIAHILKS